MSFGQISHLARQVRPAAVSNPPSFRSTHHRTFCVPALPAAPVAPTMCRRRAAAAAMAAAAAIVVVGIGLIVLAADTAMADSTPMMAPVSFIAQSIVNLQKRHDRPRSRRRIYFGDDWSNKEHQQHNGSDKGRWTSIQAGGARTGTTLSSTLTTTTGAADDPSSRRQALPLVDSSSTTRQSTVCTTASLLRYACIRGGGGGGSSGEIDHRNGIMARITTTVGGNRLLSWWSLLAAIVVETMSSTLSKHARDTSNVALFGVSCVLYLLSMVFFALCLAQIEVGVAYAVWSALGTAIVTTAGVLCFGESCDATKIACLVLIVAGVIGLQLR